MRGRLLFGQALVIQMHGTTLTDPAVCAVPFPVPARAANALVLPITATSMRAEGVDGVDGVDGRGC